MNNLEEMSLEDLKKIQLEILDYVSSFCEKNKINYWLDCGTLLGAVRHNGYIPWDDDIDIGMLREDYDKFIKLFNKQNDKYKVYSIENNKKFNYPYAKVLDTTTVLYEPDMKYGKKSCINIDVFVYDNAPDNDKKLEKIFKKRDFLLICNVVKTSPHFATKSNFVQKILRYVGYYAFKILPVGFFSKLIISNSSKYKNYNTRRVGNFTSYSKVVAEKEIFSSFIKMPFEGNEYNVPIGYDKWLKLFYKDYMQLPPVEKRKSTHKFVAFKEKKDDKK